MRKEKNWTLTDVKTGLWLESLQITPETLECSTPANWSIIKRTLHGGYTDGVDVIDVDNGALSFTIIPTRGMGLWKGRYDGCEIGWQSPVAGPVNPMFINTLECGGLGWLQGFDECIVRCGLNSNGAPGKDLVPNNNGTLSEVILPLHGRIANTPANHVSVSVIETDGVTELVITGIVDEGMLFFPSLRLETRISTIVGSNTVTLHDEVVNMNTVPRELELLYHCNYGSPFLEEGSLLVAPSRRVAPRDSRAMEDLATYHTYLPPTPGYVEQVYWHELCADSSHRTVAMLRNRAGNKGVAIRFNIQQLPCFIQWKNTAGLSDGYVTGLEPGTNLPNPKIFERQNGRVITLAPGQRHTVDLAMEIHTTAEGVHHVENEIKNLLNGTVLEVHAKPIATWSPCAV